MNTSGTVNIQPDYIHLFVSEHSPRSRRGASCFHGVLYIHPNEVEVTGKNPSATVMPRNGPGPRFSQSRERLQTDNFRLE